MRAVGFAFILIAMTSGCDGNDTCANGRCGGDTREGDGMPGDVTAGDVFAGDRLGDPCVDCGPLVRVHYDAGVGNAINIRGDGAGMSWDAGLACTWSDGNIWSCLLPVQTGSIELKPLFNDTTWAKGTNWVVEPGATLDIYPTFFASFGRVEIVTNIASASLGNSRDVAVYLPPSYDENPAKRYPVLFMHDGQNLFDAATSAFGVEWQVDEAMNDLVANGGIEEVIVVGPYNAGAGRIYEYTPTVDSDYGDGGGADSYLDFLATELRPWADSTYRTTGALSGIAGSSLGGLLSLYAGWTRPTVFGRCGVMSPSLWWDDEYLVDLIENDAGVKPDLVIYLDSGDSGPSEDGMTLTAGMRDTLVGKGFVVGDDLLYVLGEGHAHNEAAWAARVPGTLRFLFADPDRVQP